MLVGRRGRRTAADELRVLRPEVWPVNGGRNEISPPSSDVHGSVWRTRAEILMSEYFFFLILYR